MLCLKIVFIIVYVTMQDSKCKCFLNAVASQVLWAFLQNVLESKKNVLNSELSLPSYIYRLDVC